MKDPLTGRGTNLALGLALAVVVACGAARAEEPRSAPAARAPAAAPKVLRVAFPVDVTGFDPQALSDLYSYHIARAIFDTLLEYDYLARPYRLVPAAAEALPEIRDGGRTFVFGIRKGIFFADDPAFGGRRRELVAEDFVYSWKRMLDPKVRSPNALNVEGRLAGSEAAVAKARASGRFDYDAPLEGVRAVDRYTLEVRLAEPDYVFLDRVTQVPMAAVAREVIEAHGAPGTTWAMDRPVGTGPFRLREWRRGSKVVLEANRAYREERFPESAAAEDRALAGAMRGKRLPALDRVEVSIIEESNPRLLAFQSAQVDYVQLPPDLASRAIDGERLRPEYAAAGIVWLRAINPSFAYTYFNMDDPVVGGYTPERIALRRAVSMGYDTPSEIRVVRQGQGMPATQPIPPGLFGHDPTLRLGASYDPPAARALLDRFGYRDRDGDGYRERPDGSRLTLELGSAPEGPGRAIEELWKRSMDAIGIRIAFVNRRWPELLKMSQAGQLQMWTLGRQSVIRDGQITLENLYSRNIPSGQNDARFRLPEYDALFEQSKRVPDGAERAALYRRMSELVAAYAPWHVGFYHVDNLLVHPWVLGMKRHAFLAQPWKYLDVDVGLRARAAR